MNKSLLKQRQQERKRMYNRYGRGGSKLMILEALANTWWLWGTALFLLGVGLVVANWDSKPTPSTITSATATATSLPTETATTAPMSEPVPTATPCMPENTQFIDFLSPHNLAALAAEVRPVIWITGDPTDKSTWRQVCPKIYLDGAGVVFMDIRDHKVKMMPAPEGVNTNVLINETVTFIDANGDPVPFDWHWYFLNDWQPGQ